MLRISLSLARFVEVLVYRIYECEDNANAQENVEHGENFSEVRLRRKVAISNGCKRNYREV